MNAISLISPFQNEKDLNGIPKIAPCAEPCPDDRSGSIQYQDKEVRKESMLNEENTFKDLVPEMSGLYIHDFN